MPKFEVSRVESEKHLSVEEYLVLKGYNQEEIQKLIDAASVASITSYMSVEDAARRITLAIDDIDQVIRGMVRQIQPFLIEIGRLLQQNEQKNRKIAFRKKKSQSKNWQKKWKKKRK